MNRRRRRPGSPAGAGVHLLVAAATLAVALALVGTAPARAAAAPQMVSVIVTTPDLTAQMTPQASLTMQPTAPGGQLITVNDHNQFQTLKGFGAAITDSSASLISALPATTQKSLMGFLFGTGGLHLGFVRIPIGASDFTVNGTPYSYDELSAGQTDPFMTHFSIAHDTPYVLPVIRAALAANRNAWVLATPWSPPSWMKANDSLANVGGAGTLKSQYLPALARYFVDFLTDYATQGVPVDAITPQNEPGNETSYPGLNMNENEEATFVTKDLAPALSAAGLDPEIYGDDNGWTANSLKFGATLARSSAAQAFTGLATHCYFGSPSVVGQLHHDNPKLDEIVSECSPGITPFPTAELVISSLRNWASAVALWNVALDPTGGPVEAPNHGCPGCTGVVTIDPASGQVTDSIDAFELGQISKYVLPGAVRIGTNHFVSYRYTARGTNIATPGLDDVAFENPDGVKVLYVYDNATTTETFSVKTSEGYFGDTVGPGETATFIWH